MDPIRLGIIGCGNWGPNIVRNFVNSPGAEVVVVADVNEKRLNYIGDRFPSIETTQDYHDLFSMELDAAAIATQPALHYSIAHDCLQHDLGVLVEKPMTLSSQDAEQLIELASERNLRLMSGHTLVYNSAVRTLKDIMQSGELGDVFYIDSLRASLGPFRRDLTLFLRFKSVLSGGCYTLRAQRALARSKCTASVACTPLGRFFCVIP